MQRIATFAFAGLLGAATPAAAQELQDRWTGALTIYGWLPAADGDVTANSTGQTAGFSFDQSDLLDALKFAAFATLSLQRDRWGILIDGIYTSLGNTRHLPGPGDASVEGDVEMRLLTGLGAYQVYRSGGGFFVDALAGFRLNSIEVDISTQRSFPRPIGRDASGSATWVDPLVGLRVGAALTDKLAFRAVADAGGFGVGSNFTWEVFAALTYEVAPRINLALGYRYLSIDYDTGRTTIDMRLHGPTFGVAIGF